MRRFAALALSLLAFVAVPAAAEELVVYETVEVSDAGSERFVATAPAEVPHGIAASARSACSMGPARPWSM